MRRRSSTEDAHGWPTDHDISGGAVDHTVKPKSFSEIFTGRDEILLEHPNLVLVKRPTLVTQVSSSDPFVPLKSTPEAPPKTLSENVVIRPHSVEHYDSEMLFVTPPSTSSKNASPVTTRPRTTTTKAKTYPCWPKFCTHTTTTTSTATSTTTSWSTTHHPMAPRPTTPQPTAPRPLLEDAVTSSSAPAIVVLSRDRFIHRPQQNNAAGLVFVTPRSVQPTIAMTTAMPTTTKASATVSSGVPASGDVPKSWSLTNYDPRRKVKGHEYVKKTPTTTAKPRVSYVTPPVPATVSSRRVGQPPTSEAVIEQLRRQYGKRREHVDRLQTRLFKTPIKPAPQTFSRSVVNRKKHRPIDEVLPMAASEDDSNDPFTKGPSLRFDEEFKQDPAEDRSSHQYKVVHLPGSSLVHQETTSPYTTPLVMTDTSSSYLPPTPAPIAEYSTPAPVADTYGAPEAIVTHSYGPPKANPSYLPPTKPTYGATHSTTVRPSYSTILPLGSSTTTYPPVTSVLIYPSLPPTSLVPPVPGSQVYSVKDLFKPTMATTQASVVTTTGAILIPKGGLPNGPVTASYSDISPAIIILQPQTPSTSTTTSSSTTTTAVTTTTIPADIIIFPEDSELIDDGLGQLTEREPAMTSTYRPSSSSPPPPKTMVINKEFTETIVGSGDVNIAFNDTQVTRPGESIQQSINFNINVIVEKEKEEGEVDSLPRASTRPSLLPYKIWQEPPSPTSPPAKKVSQALTINGDEDTLSSPLAYTFSSSFRHSKNPVSNLKSVVSSPATQDDYLYDSELSHEDYYYDIEEFPEVITETGGGTQSDQLVEEVDLTDIELFDLYDELQLQEQVEPEHTVFTGGVAAADGLKVTAKRSYSRPRERKPIRAKSQYSYETQNDAAADALSPAKDIDLTEIELFELYDDLSDIITEVEAAMQKKVPKVTTFSTTTTPKPALAPQKIYDYIASKPWKKKKSWPNSQPQEQPHRQELPTRQPDFSRRPNFTRKPIYAPVSTLQPIYRQPTIPTRQPIYTREPKSNRVSFPHQPKKLPNRRPSIPPFTRQDLLDPIEYENYAVSDEVDHVSTTKRSYIRSRKKPKRKKPKHYELSQEDYYYDVEEFPEVITEIGGIRSLKKPRRKKPLKHYGQYQPDFKKPRNDPTFYNLTKDLIPDLHTMAKPFNWNVRDFSGWEKMFAPRFGEAEVKSPKSPSDDFHGFSARKRPEKFRAGDQPHTVTFDKILMRDPKKQMKFSRLINHDQIERNWQQAGGRVDIYDDVAYTTAPHGSF